MFLDAVVATSVSTLVLLAGPELQAACFVYAAIPVSMGATRLLQYRRRPAPHPSLHADSRV